MFLFQRYAFLMPSVGSFLAIVVGAASTCFVWWVVSQLLGQSAPLESECLEEKVEVLPRIETLDGEETVKARKKMDELECG